MELDPILAMEDSLPMMMHQTKSLSSSDDKNVAQDSNHSQLEGSTAATAAASSSVSLSRVEDPVSSLLGGGESSTSATANIQENTTTAAAAAPSTPNRQASSVSNNNATTEEELSNILSNLLLNNTLPQSTISSLQSLYRENVTLKEKNSKLKSLLGRSAKAQRDAKNELEHVKKLHEELKVEKERLERRVEVLVNRPTHMDLLADFETNFDRALLAIGENKSDRKQHQQSGGEDAAENGNTLEEDDDAITAAAAEAAANSLYEELNSSSNTSSVLRRQSSSITTRNNNDSLLLSELNEAKSRITHLESLNASLLHRTNHLEHTHKSLLSEHTHAKNTVTTLQLELRMSKMETEHAQRTLREKEAMVNEMQLEINLVTQSAVEANKRAAEGMEVVQSVKLDKEYVDGLEAKVVALQDWALASTESKQVMAEKCRGLEGRVKELEGMVEMLQSRSSSGEGLINFEDGMNINDVIPLKKVAAGSSASSLASTQGGERVLWTKSSSLVVGAGMVGQSYLELGSIQIESYETVILRWKFDLTREEEDIYFSILKGICEDKKKQRSADACFRNRHVKGGGGGDVSGAFAVQNACTLVWSNEMSWFRPKTIKWNVEAVAIEWSD